MYGLSLSQFTSRMAPCPSGPHVQEAWNDNPRGQRAVQSVWLLHASKCVAGIDALSDERVNRAAAPPTPSGSGGAELPPNSPYPESPREPTRGDTFTRCCQFHQVPSVGQTSCLVPCPKRQGEQGAAGAFGRRQQPPQGAQPLPVGAKGSAAQQGSLEECRRGQASAPTHVGGQGAGGIPFGQSVPAFPRRGSFWPLKLLAGSKANPS